MQRHAKQFLNPDSIARKYLPQTNRIWFGLSESEFNNRCALDFNSITSIYGLDAGSRMIFAIQKKDEAAIRASLIKLAQNPLSRTVARRLESFPTIAGYVIPFSLLDENWLYKTNVGPNELLELALRVSRRIRHEVGSHSTSGTDSPVKALEAGVGQCFDRASIIAAAYRLNGVPARVVGRTDFFKDGGNNSEHWWVEAYVEKKWVQYDSTYTSAIIEAIFTQARVKQISIEALPQFLAEAYQLEVNRGNAISQILSSDCHSRVEGRIVAAETNLP